MPAWIKLPVFVHFLDAFIHLLKGAITFLASSLVEFLRHECEVFVLFDLAILVRIHDPDIARLGGKVGECLAGYQAAGKRQEQCNGGCCIVGARLKVTSCAR